MGANMTDKEQVEKALHNLIDAWEALPGGTNYTPQRVSVWLIEDMKPAVDYARRAVGRPIPDPSPVTL
jgi:hypothetical protein